MSTPKRSPVQKQTARESVCTKVPGSERSEAGDKTYELILTGIRFELGLMNTRVNWLLTSQAFLFVPLVIGAEGRSLGQSPLHPHIPLLGLALCVFLTVSILAAALRILQWRAKLRGTAYADERMPSEFSGVMRNTPLIPAMAAIGAFGVPLVLILTWSWILLSPSVQG